MEGISLVMEYLMDDGGDGLHVGTCSGVSHSSFPYDPVGIYKREFY